MLGDNEESDAYIVEQQRLVSTVLDAEVLSHTAYWKKAAAQAELPSPTSLADLALMTPRRLSALGSPGELLLRPPPDAGGGGNSSSFPWRRKRSGRPNEGADGGNLSADQRYRIVTWMIEEGTLVGNTEADLLRLAEIGTRTLDLAGVTRNDGIVGLVPTGPTLSSWQLTLGARQAGVALAGLAPVSSLDTIALLGPTVLAGRPDDLVRVLDGLSRSVRDEIAAVMVVTRTPIEQQERVAVRAALGRVEGIVEVWSPPGVRALWAQCRGGEGVHTWPQTELIEVCQPNGTPVPPGDEGELVWTGLGWRGTVVVRLATGVRGRLVEAPCMACGRTTPRILGARSMTAASAAKTTRRASLLAASEPPRPPRNEEAPTSVRAVAKEDPFGPVAAQAPAPAPAEAPVEAWSVSVPVTSPVDSRPRPSNAPGAAGADAAADVWFPGTSAVDAWPAPVLAATYGLAAWQVEHRQRRGHDEMVVYLALVDDADLGEVLVSLERSLGATQYVIIDRADLEVRLAVANGNRVVDTRDLERT